MNRKLALMSCILALFALSGCETVKGVARDVEHGADTVQGWF